MTNVPAEYLSFDFGFSAVDEKDMLAKQKAPTVEAPVIDTSTIEEKFDRIDEKLDQVLIEFARMQDNVAANATEDEMRDKIRQLEAIIVPLLNNLLKTADKEWIHWPNRRETVQLQLDKVLKITRG
jgi:hypothetical protein